MKFVFLIIILIFGLQIFRTNGSKRFYLYSLAILLIPNVMPLPLNGVHPHRFFAICFFLSLIKWNEFNSIKKIPFLLVFILLFCAHFLTGFYDERLSIISKIWKPLAKFIETFGILFLGYCTNMSQRDWMQYLVKMNKVIVCISIYALITLVIKVDPYAVLIDNTFGLQSDYSSLFSGLRLRIVSTLYNSHLFAFFSAVWLIINAYRIIMYGLTRQTILTTILLFINILISGSRSSLMGAIVGVALVFLLQGRKDIYLKFFLIFFVFMLPISQIDFVKSKIDSLTSIFDSNTQQEGSSIDMREEQLNISLYYWSKDPVWGNGIDYFGEELSSDSVETGLYGAESYLFILLIENGTVQIVLILLLFLVLEFYFLVKKKNRNKHILGVALLTTFVIVSFATGNAAKWELVFPFIGLLLNKHNLSY